jgi:hypothetical protein
MWSGVEHGRRGASWLVFMYGRLAGARKQT